MARLPSSWSTRVGQVLLAAGPSMSTSYHRKERVVCLYCPSGSGEGRNKRLAATLFVHAIAAAAGEEVSDELELECIEAVGGPSA